jgi:hypothetical protein
MSNDKLFNISNGYMLHCGINWCDMLIEKKGELIQDILPYSQPEADSYLLHISSK